MSIQELLISVAQKINEINIPSFQSAASEIIINPFKKFTSVAEKFSSVAEPTGSAAEIALHSVHEASGATEAI